MVSGSQDGSIKIYDLLEARPIYDVLGHKSAVTSVRFASKGDFFASGSEDKMVYIWKTNFDEIDEKLLKDSSRVRFSIGESPEENVENLTPQSSAVLQEKSTNQKVHQPEPEVDTSAGLAAVNTKLDMIMSTLVLMDKRLTLVEDQMRNNQENK